MLSRITAALAAALVLAGCETPTTGRYAISAENNMSIKALGATGISLSKFQEPASFSAGCRALGPLRVADGLTHTAYIQKAFEDELKVAGAYTNAAPRIVLSGAVTKMEFSSTRAMTGGSWTIDLDVSSSNGKKLSVAEYYEFDSGFIANEACRQTADAFSRAVQNLIGKTVRQPTFASLLQ